MIYANEIIDYNRTDAQLEELILFLIAVAGKNANSTAIALEKLLVNPDLPKHTMTPFEQVRLFAYFGEEAFKQRLKNCGFGCQTRLAKGFTEIAKSGLDLKTCSLEDLMKIHGIGRKSASCFLAWTREGVKVAMLDTHLMKFIREFLGYPNAPKATPAKREYDFYEKVYLDHCEKKGVNPTDFDLAIWRYYSNGKDERLLGAIQ